MIRVNQARKMPLPERPVGNDRFLRRREFPEQLIQADPIQQQMGNAEKQDAPGLGAADQAHAEQDVPFQVLRAPGVSSPSKLRKYAFCFADSPSPSASARRST